MGYYPEDFGAVGDGVTDDTAALQEWLNDLSAGRVRYLSAKTYAFSQTLVIGNGTLGTLPSTPAVLSNPPAFTIAGAGSGGSSRNPPESGLSRLKWIGAAHGTMMKAVSTDGLFLSGFVLDGNGGTADYGIQLLGDRGTLCTDIAVLNCQVIDWYLTGVLVPFANGYEGPAQGTFINCSFGASISGVSASSPMIGIALGGNPTNPLDYTSSVTGGRFLNDFINFRGRFDGSDNSIALDLRTCDHNYFYSPTLVAKSALRASQNPNMTGFPSGNRIYAGAVAGNAYTGSNPYITTNGTFSGLPANGDFNYAELVDGGNQYPGNSTTGGGASWPVVTWLQGKTATGIRFGTTPMTRAPLHYVDRVGTDTLSNFTGFTQLNGGTSYVIKGQQLDTLGAKLRIAANGNLGNVASATVRFQLRLGSTVLFDSLGWGAGTATSAQAWGLDVETVVKSIGSSGSLFPTQQIFMLQSFQNGSRNNIGTFAPTTLDLTADQAVSVWASFAAADPANTVTLGVVFVEISYPPFDAVR